MCPHHVSPIGADADRQAFERRVELRDKFDKSFDRYDADLTAKGLKLFQTEARHVLRSDSIRHALDISQEPEFMLEKYGNGSEIGRNALRARRLVEAGSRFVTVGYSGWDTHTNNFGQLRTALLPRLDSALSGLITDLETRGLLESTIVCCCGEFGRTPSVNALAGRDHWSQAFSALVAGGGFANQAAFGRTDEHGQRPISDPCTPADLCATLLHLLGVEPSDSITMPSGRTMKIIESGTILKSILG